MSARVLEREFRDFPESSAQYEGSARRLGGGSAFLSTFLAVKKVGALRRRQSRAEVERDAESQTTDAKKRET